MSNPLIAAIHPSTNAVVHAAAGTGKTWLLTSRIVRLLLAGVEPGAILAITFTRKAAQEMTARVHQRLLAMAVATETERDALFQELGVADDETSRELAPRLYEKVLASTQPLRTTTFHAFCQELLRRFAFEAGVPPAFDIVEDTESLRSEAWLALTHDLTVHAADTAAQAMDLLLRELGGLNAVREALYEFLDHCSDWWAYTENAANPLDAALQQLFTTYGALDENPARTLLERLDFAKHCRDFVAAVGPSVPASMRDRVRAAEAAGASPSDDPDHALTALVTGFFTQKGAPRSLPKAVAENSAADGQTLSELHRQMCSAIEHAWMARQERLAHTQTAAWYRCGERFLTHYQHLKQERGQLDFADLEWLAYRLLAHGDQAAWVQYKLDQRIDHLLVDEFQDTNPTQWRLILPLLQELAAGDPERQRSVFLVGDEKQSIYRFRRAETQLFHQAHHWLMAHAGAQPFTQDVSWRSSPAILAFVNLLFATPKTDDMDFALPDFRPHAAHYTARPGVVEIGPLVHATEKDSTKSPDSSALRNPLTTPRENDEDRRYQDEAQWIAQKIAGLVENRIGIAANDAGGSSIRPIGYGDIFVLLRDRAHAEAYETALREAGIPFLGASRGQFSDALEIRDLTNLLRVLIAPHDDLALAGVLRSPLFAVSDEALMLLASANADQPWWSRINQLANDSATSDVLRRAWRQLSSWQRLADRVPVHDLLDRIYDEGNVIARYASATPVQLRARVQTNLHRFIALALDFDSGRYPSLSRFIRTVEAFPSEGADTSPDFASTTPDDCVRVLTIHAAKGLEAPVVLLADMARGGNPRARVPWALVDWPVDEARPTRFLLGGRQERLDRHAQAVYEKQLAAARREEANLLYVALTRARQMLFLSASAPRSGSKLGWYGFIQHRLRSQLQAINAHGVTATVEYHHAKDRPASLTGQIRFGEMATVSPAPVTTASRTSTDSRLHQPFSVEHPLRRRRPSEAIRGLPPDVERPTDALDGRVRGIVIHRALDLATTIADRTEAQFLLQREFGSALRANDISECWREALAVVLNPDLARFFNPTYFRRARNELPILYADGDAEIYGIMDRVIESDAGVTIVDYKTNRITSATLLDELAARYTPQLALYARGAAKIWPRVEVRAALIFTAVPSAIEIPVDT